MSRRLDFQKHNDQLKVNKGQLKAATPSLTKTYVT